MGVLKRQFQQGQLDVTLMSADPGQSAKQSSKIELIFSCPIKSVNLKVLGQKQAYMGIA